MVHFDSREQTAPLSVREALRGKQILLIGATGFIGKVWLANLLTDLPEIGRVYLLIRRNRSATALERFQRMVEESPVFEPLAARHGDGFADFLRERVEVVDGDVSKPGLGLAPEVRQRLARSLDLIVNSSGLTDFNPGPARRAGDERPRDRRTCWISCATAITPPCCIFPPATSSAAATAAFSRILPKNYTPRGVPGFRRRKGMALARRD